LSELKSLKKEWSINCLKREKINPARIVSVFGHSEQRVGRRVTVLNPKISQGDSLEEPSRGSRAAGCGGGGARKQGWNGKALSQNPLFSWLMKIIIIISG